MECKTVSIYTLNLTSSGQLNFVLFLSRVTMVTREFGVGSFGLG